MQTQTYPSERYLRPYDAARLLAISRKTLARWRSAGEGPPARRIGAAIRYPESALHAWVSRQAARGEL